MKIFNFMAKLPGGLILVPMFIASIPATFCPAVLKLGGLSTALFSGQATEAVIGILLFLAGLGFDLGDVWPALKRGGVLSLARLIIGVAVCALTLRLWGPAGCCGISVVALVVAMVGVNPGVYLAVVNEHGDRFDPPGFSLLNIVAVPAIPVVILGAINGGGFNWMVIVTTLLPFLLGMLLGNLDKQLRQVFVAATPAVLFIAGIQFGANLDWRTALAAGWSGLLLSAIYLIVSLPLMLLVDRRVLGRPGYAAVSMTSLAGVCTIMPAAIGEALPVYAPYVAAATGQIAMTMALTNLLAMPLIKACLKKWGGAGQNG